MGGRLRRTLGLFLRFFQFGCFTFGGGWAIIAQMQKEYVDKQHLITEGELLDIASVGKSLPGVMVSNTAFLFGYRICGLAGGLACVIGMVIPPILTLTVVTLFYNAFCHNPYVAKAMIGVRAAVVPIIFNALLRLRKGAFPHPLCYGIALGALCLSLFFNTNSAYIVMLAALAGVGICHLGSGKQGREKKDGAA